MNTQQITSPQQSRLPLKRRQRGMLGMSDSMVQVLFYSIMAGLIVVGAGYGILSYARGLKYFDAGSQLSTTWKNIASACGTTQDITSANLTGTASAAANLQLLVEGPATLSTAYKACYKMSSAEPVRGSIDGLAGDYTVSNVPLTVAYDATNKRIKVIYTGVTEDDTVSLMGKYSSNTALKNKDPLGATDSDTTDPKIQLGGTTGSRIVTLLY